MACWVQDAGEGILVGTAKTLRSPESDKVGRLNEFGNMKLVS